MTVEAECGGGLYYLVSCMALCHGALADPAALALFLQGPHPHRHRREMEKRRISKAETWNRDYDGLHGMTGRWSKAGQGGVMVEDRPTYPPARLLRSLGI